MTPKFVFHGTRLADVLNVTTSEREGASYCAYLLHYRDDGSEGWIPRFQVRELSAAELIVLGLRERVRGK